MPSPLDDIFGPPKAKGSLLDDVFGPPKRPVVDASILGGLGIDPEKVRRIPDRTSPRPPAQGGPAPDDSWKTTAKKLLQNYDDSLGTTIGGLLQSSSQVFEGVLDTVPGIGAVRAARDYFVPEAKEAQERALAPLTDPLKRAGKGIYDRSSAELRRNAPKLDDSPGKQFVYDLGNVIADLGIATGVSIATRSPKAGQAFMGARVFGSKFGESVAAGRTEDQAFVDASVHAIAETVGEGAVISRFMKPGEKFGRKVVEGAVGEAVQEGVTSLIQNGYDAGVIGEDTTFGEFVRNVGYDMLLGAGGGASVAAAAAPFAKREVKVPGRIEAANIESDPTPEDVASPLPTDLVSEGKALMQGAAAKLEADKILAKNAVPSTGSVVELGGQKWTVDDAFADEAGEEGVTLRRDGQVQKVYFADLADAGMALMPVEAEGKLEPSPIDEAVEPIIAPVSPSADISRRAKKPQPKLGDRDQIITFVMNDLEGGGQRVVDSGGVTRFGVSKDANPDVDVENLTAAGAAEIYRRRYWNPLMLGASADPAFAMVAFDAAINHGVGGARKMMKAAGGDVGALLAARRAEYARLIAQDPGQYGRYANGWSNRLKKLEAAIGGAAPAQAAVAGAEEVPAAAAAPGASEPSYGFLNAELLPDREMDQIAAPAPVDQPDLARMVLESEAPAAPEPAASVAPPALDDGRGDGSRAAPRRVETAEDLEIVAPRVDEPTEAQAGAGNYKHAHVKFQGLDIAIENPAGSTRRGVDPDGQPWETVIPAAYGRLKRTTAADGENVDVYLGPNPASDRAFVIDQYDPKTRAFDETKTILGVGSEAEALAIYDAGFSDGSGPSRRGAVTPMTVEGFKEFAEQRGDQPASGAVELPAVPAAAEVDVDTAAPPLQNPPQDPANIEGAFASNGAQVMLPETSASESGGAGIPATGRGSGPEPGAPVASEEVAGDTEVPGSEALSIAAVPAGRFDPAPHIEKLRSYVANPRNPIGDIGRVAKRLGVNKLQARKVVGALTAQPNSGLFMSKTGNLRRVPQRKGPVSLLSFLKDRGGFVAPTRHRLTTRGRDLHKSFPGLISGKGIAFDEAVEAAVEAGYFSSRDTGTVTEDDFLQAVERAGDFYRPEDQAEVLEKRARAAGDTRPSARDRLDEVLSDPAMVDFLPAEITDSDRAGILELMSEDPDGINADPFVAAPEYFVRRMAAVLDTAIAETGDQAYEIPFDIEVPRETGSPDAREDDGTETADAGGRPASERGDEGRSGTAGAGRGEDGRVEPEQADAFGERPEDRRVALERRGDGRKRSDRAQKPPGSDGGLFDDNTGRQLDIEDATPIAQAKAALQQAMDALDKAAAPKEAEPAPADQPLFSLSDPTSSPEFKRWFGDSKVVDENGAPLVVYHGTQEGFEAFDASENGVFFTPSRQIADAYGRGYDGGKTRIVSAYLSLQNPITTDDAFLADVAKTKADEVLRAKAEAGSSLPFSEAFEDGEKWARDIVFAEAKARGRDGLIIPRDISPTEDMSGDWDYAPSYVAFVPSQIKSTANRGTWDPNDDRMNFSLSGSGEEVFYSALERAIEASPTKRAPAAQWAATLGKTPGVKKEELEWSGLFDWLDMQTGPVDREALLQVVRDGGIKVEEVVLGGDVESRLDNVEDWYVGDKTEQGWPVYDGSNKLISYGKTEEEAEEMASIWSQETAIEQTATKFKDWSSDPSNDTYRELLITLPVGTGGNPDRAPSTHWDQKAVVAHARFMEKTDAEGKRVLFIEEVQSDWHQKGRDEGYERTANPAEVTAREEDVARTEQAFLDAAAEMERVVLGAGRGLPGNTGSENVEVADRLATSGLYGMGEVPGFAEADEALDAARLAWIEARSSAARARSPSGIPDAPFKSTWPALVMKRMISWGATNGFDRIAWTTGAEQADRYGLNSDKAEGMRGFYDRNLVNITNDILKKFGVKVGRVGLGTVRLKQAELELAAVEGGIEDGMQRVRDRGQSEADIQRYAERQRVRADELRAQVEAAQSSNPGFDITPELRQAARGGFPLFNRRNNATDRSISRDSRRAGLLARGEPPAPKDFAQLALRWKPKLEASLKRLGIDDRILLNVVERLDANPTADGSYYRRVISVALETSPAPARTFNHEAIHALRALGLFRSAEWTAVVKAAEPMLADVGKRYEGQRLNPEQTEEEAVADLYAAWQEKRDSAKGFAAKAFQRIADLFRAFRAALAGDVDAQAVFRAVEGGRVGRRETGFGAREPADPIFSTDAFRRWFGKSAVVDANGVPRVVYHGTAKAFDAVDMSKGDQGVFWITSDRGKLERGEAGAASSGTIMSLYAKIERPAGWDEYDRMSIDELERDGFDGVILPAEDGTDNFDAIVFAPSQIKSTANRGTWDPNDDRIMFSLSDPAPTKRIRVIKKNAFPDASIEANFLIERGTGPRWPKGLNLGDYDLFWRKVMVDELQGQDELPYGFTAESLTEAKRHIDKLVSGSAVVEAAARRYNFAKMLDEQVQGVVPADITEARAEPPEGGEPPRAANIRLDKLESPADIGAALEAIAERFDEFDDSRRGVISQEETARLAEDLNLTPEQLLARRKGQAFNAHELLAARQLLVASADNMVELAAKAQGGSDEDLVNFRRAWIRHVAIQEQVSGMTAEAGRALNQFKMLARAGGDLNARMMREVLNTEGGRDDVENVAKAILGFANDPAKMNSFARDAYSPTWRDKLFELWINGLLSGPATHIVNAVSNTLTSLTQMPEYAAAAAIGKARSLTSGDVDRIYGSEIGARAAGMIQGARESSLLAVEALRTGEGSDVLSKMEARTQRAISGFKGDVIRVPSRLLVASDEFFKGTARRMEMSALAVRMATKEGLTGDEFRARVAELNAEPTPEMVEAGMEFARYSTFTRPLGPMGQSITNMINAVPGMRIIVPFIRTPANIFKFAIARTPAAPILREVREDFKAGGVSRDLAVARVVLGSSLGATVMMLAAAGILTGGDPEDEDARRLLKANGWQPYSIKIGSTYYSYQRLDPLATILGLGADLAATHEHMSEEEREDAYSNMFMSIMNQMKNKTFLSGIGSMIEAIEDPGRFGPVFLGKLAGSVIPTGIAQVNNQLDPNIRDVRTPLQRIQSRVPGLSDDLMPKRDIWGRPIVREGGVGPDFASPFWTTKDRADPVNEALLELGVTLNVPSRKVSGIELTPEQYDQYQELAGAYLRRGSENLIQSRAWEVKDDEDKRELFDKVKNAARKRARRELGLSKAALEAQAAAGAD